MNEKELNEIRRKLQDIFGHMWTKNKFSESEILDLWERLESIYDDDAGEIKRIRKTDDGPET